VSKILFRGAIVRYCDLRADEAGPFVRVHLSADFSAPVRQEMGWGEIPDSITSCKLEGKLDARHLVLTPNQQQLRQHEIQISADDVSDFQVSRTEGEDGGSKQTALRFALRSRQEGAAAQLENWLRVIGDGSATLKVEYAVQQKLFDQTETEGPETEGPETDAEFADVDDQQPEAGSLAPAVLVAGNTDKLKRQRKARVPVEEMPLPEWRTEDERAAGVPRETAL
jgi:hypothetical protein